MSLLHSRLFDKKKQMAVAKARGSLITSVLLFARSICAAEEEVGSE